ncbi:NADP-dependent oxidoreductase [Vibrio tapetis subsp. quintayensis]|uniref:NADP-dependent oxidoreductase n=1 Tax=Vibrio tapetis TaxID=52443 RepID=UPI0025B2A055|nr:NADP-dependent oxidoreductase [Vibrio tapetis]MDN3682790.1 NADP-dependent oxidoreductase [Vibrio tapetis subsp. quintayensis]
MKSFVIKQAGGIENLQLTQIDKPIVQSGEVLVETRALSINPADTKVKYAQEALNNLFGDADPMILGWDIAGTVVAIADDVTEFSVGDKVFGMVNFPGHGKAYAEYVAAPADQLATIPSNTSFNDAAATTLAALTALQVLSEVKADDRVLIHAGSGGVGHFAIQIAKSLGAYVISTSSAKNRDFILSLGADQHIDYRTEAFEKVAIDIDFVFDTLGLETAMTSLQTMKKGGSLTSIAMMGLEPKLENLATELSVNVSTHMVHSNGKDMATLKAMLEDGRVTPHISQTFDFENLPQAHTAIESGRTLGKVIITL